MRVHDIALQLQLVTNSTVHRLMLLPVTESVQFIRTGNERHNRRSELVIIIVTKNRQRA